MMRPLPAANVLLLLLFLLPVPGQYAEEAENPVLRQSLNMEIEEAMILDGLREDSAANPDNWMALPEGQFGLGLDLDWQLTVLDAISLRGGGGIDWIHSAEPPDAVADPVVHLDTLLFQASLPELSARLRAGKDRLGSGAAFLFHPAALMDQNGENGLLFTALDFFPDSLSFSLMLASRDHTWPEADQLQGALEVSGLVKNSQWGVLLRLDDHLAGSLWFSTQLADSLIPCLELAVYSHATDYARPEAFDKPALEALGGVSWSIPESPLQLYAEYRYRSAGWNSSDWEALASALPADPMPADPLAAGQWMQARAAAFAAAPRLNGAMHTLGLRLQNQSESVDAPAFAITGFWMIPHTVWLRAEASVGLAEHLYLSLAGSLVEATAPGGAEAPWWPWRGRLEASIAWRARFLD